MELKSYLLQKPDAYRFAISYEFVNRCPHCKRDFVTIDDEYSTDETTAAGFRAEVETNSGHFGGYSFIYEMDTDESAVTITAEGGREVITVTIYDDQPRECEQCAEEWTP